jgi:hypothetical protein
MKKCLYLLHCIIRINCFFYFLKFHELKYGPHCPAAEVLILCFVIRRASAKRKRQHETEEATPATTLDPVSEEESESSTRMGRRSSAKKSKLVPPVAGKFYNLID